MRNYSRWDARARSGVQSDAQRKPIKIARGELSIKLPTGGGHWNKSSVRPCPGILTEGDCRKEGGGGRRRRFLSPKSLNFSPQHRKWPFYNYFLRRRRTARRSQKNDVDVVHDDDDESRNFPGTIWLSASGRRSSPVISDRLPPTGIWSLRGHASQNLNLADKWTTCINRGVGARAGNAANIFRVEVRERLSFARQNPEKRASGNYHG